MHSQCTRISTLSRNGGLKTGTDGYGPPGFKQVLGQCLLVFQKSTATNGLSPHLAMLYPPFNAAIHLLAIK